MKKNIIKKRDEVTDVAIKLFLKQGVQKTSMRDIAKELNLTTGSLYYYFTSKDEIIDHVAESGAQGVEGLREFYRTLTNENSTEVLRKCIIYLLLDAYEGRNHILFFNREWLSISQPRGQALREDSYRIVDFFEHLLDEGTRTGEFKIKNQKIAARNIWFSQQEVALRGWFLKEDFTPTEFAEKQADFILDAICSVESKNNIPRI